MRSPTLVAAVVPAVLLGGCATANAQSPYPHRSAVESFECRNTGLAQFAGQAPTPEVARRILTASGAKVLRWVPHGTVITMEYSSERVTVYLDPQSRIERATCG